MKWVVDRIESNTAIIEVDKEYINVHIKFLPIGVKEGDVLSVNIDADATSEQLQKARRIMNDLFSE